MPETHDFAGRQLEIEDHSHASKQTKALIRKVLCSFCQHSPVALKIKKMKVVLEDQKQENKRDLIEQIRSNDGFNARCSMAGEAPINFPANHVDILLDRGRGVLNFTKAFPPKVPEKWVADAITRTFVHEATHVLHYEISTYLRIELAAIKKVKELTTRLAATSAELQRMRVVEAISIIRQFLFTFIRMLQIEGVAMFVREVASGKIFYNDAMLESTYHKAEQQTDEFLKVYYQIEQLLKSYDEIRVDEIRLAVEKKRIAGFFQEFTALVLREGITYTIGAHMAYTIIYIEKGTTFEDLLRISSFEFIKRYEAAIEKKGMRPIISLTSKRGILDYSQLVSIFAKFVEQFKDRS